MMTFQEAVEKGKVWLAGFPGMGDVREPPWACIGLPSEAEIKELEQASGEPVFLMLMADAGDGKIEGILQISHQRVNADDVLSKSEAKAFKTGDLKHLSSHCLAVTRAWMLNSPVELATVWAGPADEIIGANAPEMGVQLTPDQAAAVSEWSLREVDLRSMPSVSETSKAGPVAQGHYSAENKNADTKHIYILELEVSDASPCAPFGQVEKIVKPGLSFDPRGRMDIYRAHLPPIPGMNWHVRWSTQAEGCGVLDGETALAGEKAFQEALTAAGARVEGREFFSATEDQIKQAIAKMKQLYPKGPRG